MSIVLPRLSGSEFGAPPFGLWASTPQATFRVEKPQTARIKGIVSSSGYKSVSPNGV